MAKRQSSVKESAVERELIRRVRARGGLCVKVQALGTRGFFDRIVVLPGRVVLTELKRPRGGRLSPHQMRYQQEFVTLGVEVVVVRNSEDIDLLLSPP